MIIDDKLKLLPTTPGCYLMKNSMDEIIYVGKAKNLRQRVKSYFTGAHNEKTILLVSEIVDFSYVLTNSEQESLILELNLIKKHLPKYNIKLIDDKTYPYIEITNEENPKLRVVRKKNKNSTKIFGPYPNVYAARETVRLLNRIYPLRKCENIPKKECLYYHMKQCLAPCIVKEKIDYTKIVSDISRFLKGDNKETLKKINDDMQEASLNLEFEKAIEYRNIINSIKSTTEKQIINLNDFKDRDFISFARNSDDISIQILKMRQGRIVDNHQIVFGYVGDSIDSITSYIQQYYDVNIIPDEMLFNDSFDITQLTSIWGNKAIIPHIGDKKKIIDLATKNAKMDLENYYLLYRHKDELKDKAILELTEIVKKEVRYVEVFDNAQLFGSAPISAMIVYENRNFNRKMYRKFHLKTTINDDYQAMREVVYRRYQRLLVEGSKLPDLILVDGGIGQLHAAEEVLVSLGMDIPVAGLKKNDKHQLDALVYKNNSHKLNKTSELYRFLVKLSTEVHRFAITFHRETRQKISIISPLDKIEGIGKKRKEILLKSFNNITEIKNATFEELKKLGLSEKIIKSIKEDL